MSEDLSALKSSVSSAPSQGPPPPPDLHPPPFFGSCMHASLLFAQRPLTEEEEHAIANDKAKNATKKMVTRAKKRAQEVQEDVLAGAIRKGKDVARQRKSRGRAKER